MHTEPADMDVIARVLNGDGQSYSLLVDRYRSFVFTIVLRYIRSREDAEEVAQDIFVKAYRSLPDFRGGSKFSTWLYTVATSTCLTFLRKNKLAVRSLDEEGVLEAVSSISGGPGADAVEQKSRTRLVNKAIGMLGAEDAQVITLFYKGEQTLEEIAQAMGKAPNAVKVQLHRARTRLKEKMERHFSEAIKDIY